MNSHIKFAVGDKVKKISGKPFKSTLKVNTIKEFCINEQDPKCRESVKFEEDTSVVTIDHIEKV